MRRLCLLIITVIIFGGCATISVESFNKPGVDIKNYSKIGITKFICSSDPVAGQEVADIIALQFIKKGFDVIERTQLEAILAEEEITQIGITEPTKLKLRLKGISGVIVGSLTRYECQTVTVPFVYGYMAVGITTNNCHASLAVKLLDVETGSLLWAANGSHSINEEGMTAGKVLKEVMDGLQKEIPPLYPQARITHNPDRETSN